MGEVYRARDPRIGREVAVKVLPRDLVVNREVLLRFEQEARAVGALNHPALLTLHDVSLEGDTPYLVTELLTGETLAETMAGRPVPVRKALDYAAQIASGLAAAHEQGVVHRDVKPANVFITADGRAKILDFGIAKLAHGPDARTAPLTAPGMIIGTLDYMSPEQINGGAIDFRSDQFSFGVMLHQLLTGQHPFRRDSAMATMTAILEAEPPPIGSDAPPPLRWLIERCLAKSPSERYASTADLARDLRVLREHITELSTSPAAASPTSRRKWLIAGAMVLLLAAAGAFMIFRPRTAEPPSFRRLTFRTGRVATARFLPDAKSVVFSARWDGSETDEIFTTTPTSSEPRALGLTGIVLAAGGNDEIAFRRSELRATGTLARIALGGGAPREVAEAVRWADFSPGGELAAIRSEREKMWIEYPPGTKVYETAAGTLSFVRVSRDGRSLAFALQGAGLRGGTLMLLDVRTRETRSVSGDWSVISGLAWRDDDEIWISGSRQEREEPSIYSVTTSGRTQVVYRAPIELELKDLAGDGAALLTRKSTVTRVRFTSRDVGSRDLSWLDWSIGTDLSRDGTTALFNEEGTGAPVGGKILLRATDGSPPVDLGEGYGVALSRDGKQVIAFSGLRRDTGGYEKLLIVPAGAGQTRVVPRGSIDVYGEVAQMHPDGRRVVFVGQERGGAMRLYAQDVAGPNPVAISPPGVSHTRGLTISNDGTRVTFEHGGTVFLASPDGSKPRAVKGARERDIPIGWSANDRELYVVRENPPRAEVLAIDPETGLSRAVKALSIAAEHPRGVIRRVRMSADETSFFYTVLDSHSDLFLVRGLH